MRSGLLQFYPGAARSLRRVLLSSLLAAPFTSNSYCYAANDGLLDTTSTGDTSISLGVSNLVRLSGMADINLGTYSGFGDFSKSQDVCVWTNQASGAYKVTAHGSGLTDAFTVTRGSGTPIPYTVRWNNTTGTDGNALLAASTQSSALTGASTTSQECGGTANSNFQVTFSAASLLSATPGNYTGVLTLVIAPAS